MYIYKEEGGVWLLPSEVGSPVYFVICGKGFCEGIGDHPADILSASTDLLVLDGVGGVFEGTISGFFGTTFYILLKSVGEFGVGSSDLTFCTVPGFIFGMEIGLG